MKTVMRALALVAALTALGALESGCRHTFPMHPGASVIKKDGTVVYIVKRGDTLYSIGRRFGVDYRLLARRNHLRKPYTIYLGQRLYINRTAPKPRALPVKTHRHASAKTRRTRNAHAHNKTRHARRHAARPKAQTHAAAPSGQAHRVRRRHAQTMPVRLLWPLRGTITSRFGRRGSRLHDGIDIAAPEGTPVHAAAAGTVVYADRRLSGYGNLIILRHSGDVFTAYAHNQRNLVRKGQRVRAGDIIARVGRTGRASGPHLHFEVRRGTTPVDPLAYLPRR